MYSAKQVIVMRRDLKMRKGKIAAQAGHACVEATLRALSREGLLASVTFTDEGMLLRDAEAHAEVPVVRWFADGEAKICVYVDGEDALLAIHRQVTEAGHISALIQDAGCTEFHGEPTFTCLAIEPLPRDAVDPFTGSLPLY